ncbi:1-phosphofructokinase, partial [Bacillus velezensis]
VASGSATAFSEELGTEEFVQQLLPEVKVTRL